MKYISSIEQMAMMQGREEGREAERMGLLMRLLERLLGPVNSEMREAIEQLGRDKQLQLVDDLLDFKHFDDLEAWLAHHVNPL